MSRKYLIVNADDFGLSDGVNRGIFETAERGILTSASLMVRQPAAAAAAAYARKAPRLSIGLHLDLGEWVYRNDEWVPLYSVVSTEDAEAVAGEVAHQLATFQRLMGRNPTHLDSHQHVHRSEPVRSIVADLAGRLKVPLREHSPKVRYCGDFYGQDGEGRSLAEALTVEALKNILESLPTGVTELGCHPGYDDGLATAYRAERAREVETLCAPAVREAVATLGIQLRSFEATKVATKVATTTLLEDISLI
jgi:predicted glycoside hydrolase/deacetylase ChbG (UPF0249 family)